MIRLLRDFRVVPVVLTAVTVLFALKTLGLVLDGGYTLGDADTTGSVDRPIRFDTAASPGRARSWAQQMFNFPDVTGSTPQPSPPAETAMPGSTSSLSANCPSD